MGTAALGCPRGANRRPARVERALLPAAFDFVLILTLPAPPTLHSSQTGKGTTSVVPKADKERSAASAAEVSGVLTKSSNRRY